MKIVPTSGTQKRRRPRSICAESHEDDARWIRVSTPGRPEIDS